MSDLWLKEHFPFLPIKNNIYAECVFTNSVWNSEINRRNKGCSCRVQTGYVELKLQLMEGVQISNVSVISLFINTCKKKMKRLRLLFQMNLHNLRYLYIRTDEMPFNSDNKYMYVQCTPRYGQVCTLFTGNFNQLFNITFLSLLGVIIKRGFFTN